MTCRVARLSQSQPRMNLVFCSECDSASLEVCHTSNTLKAHLCPTCARSMVEYGAREESRTQSATREQSVDRDAGISTAV
jgi:hypothetical protein